MSHKVLKDVHGYRLEDLVLATQRGLVPDAYITWKFGYSTAAGTTIETIWDHTGLYVYHLDYGASAKAIDIVSSSASDTAVTITVQGLDADGVLQTVTKTLTGTTAVTTTETWSRVFRAYNSSSTNLVGAVTITETAEVAKILAKVSASDQQTLMAVYTIPLGYTGYLFQGTANIGSGKEAVITYTTRANGGVFRTQEKLPIYQAIIEASRPFQRIPALTDIEVRAAATQTGNVIGATMGILVIKD